MTPAWDDDGLFESNYRARQHAAPSFDQDPRAWLQHGADLLWLALVVLWAVAMLGMMAVLG